MVFHMICIIKMRTNMHVDTFISIFLYCPFSVNNMRFKPWLLLPVDNKVEYIQDIVD